jgi:hypothetical protein
MDPFPLLGRKSDFEGTFGEIWLDTSGFAHKKFKATTPEADRQHLLELNFLLERIRPSRQRTLKTMFAWPLEIYGTQNSASGKVSVDGYRMPAAGPEFQLTLPWRDPSWDKKRSATLDWLVDENARTQPNLSKPLPSVPLGERIEVAYQFLLACRELWGAGCVYGDFSYKNILWTGGPTPGVLLLDTDTISVNPKIDRKIHSPYFREFIDTNESASVKDAKLAMLVVWRILFGGLRSTPDEPGNQHGPQLRAVVGAIKKAWRSGKDSDACDVMSELHGTRDDSLIRSHLQAALELDTVFARQVLDHEPHSLNGSERDLFREAAEQLKTEEKYERRPRRRRSPTLSSTFSFDVASWYEFDILNQELLFAAFRDGDFEIIATELPRVTSTSPNLHVIRRAVEHALVEIPTPKVSTTAIPRGSEIHFAWPPGDWINQAVLALYASDGSVLRTHTFQRGVTTTRLRITNNSSQIIDSIEMAWAANSKDTKVQVIAPTMWRCQFTAIAGTNQTTVTSPVAPRSAALQWIPAGAGSPTAPAIFVKGSQRTVPAHRLLDQRPRQTVTQSRGKGPIGQLARRFIMGVADRLRKTRNRMRT